MYSAHAAASMSVMVDDADSILTTFTYILCCHTINGPPKIVVPPDCPLRRIWPPPGQTLETNPAIQTLESNPAIQTLETNPANHLYPKPSP